MKIYFLTGNRHKLDEATAVLRPFGIDVEKLDMEKYEPKEMSLREVTEYNARKIHDQTGLPVVVEDTGVFFDAFPKFPGNHPKLMFDLLGYKGLLKLLEGETRKAHFKSVLTFCDGKRFQTFEGTLDGTIAEGVHDMGSDTMPYERIFICDGKPMSSFSREDKNKVSHRSKSFRKLGEWLVSRERK